MKRIVIIAVFTFCTALVSPARAQQAAEAKQSQPSSAQSFADVAIACLKRGEDATDPQEKLRLYREGLALGRRAVALDDGNADAHFAVFANNGRIMLLEGVSLNPLNLVRANAELERTLEIQPNHYDALAAKGGLYRQLPWALGGDLDKAEETLRKAIDLNPNAVGARIELALTYRDKGEPGRGRPLLETAARIAEQQGKQRQLREARELLREIDGPH